MLALVSERVDYMTINLIAFLFPGQGSQAVGMGGALAVMVLGHIDPNFSYWTTSGEFVFVAILAGSQSVVAVMLSFWKIATTGLGRHDPACHSHFRAW